MPDNNKVITQSVIFVHLSGVVVSTLLSFAGLTVREFEGISSVLEVVCSGRTLKMNSDLLTITLHASMDNDVIASLNLRKLKCQSSYLFTSCHMDESDSRKTLLRVLVLDLADGERRRLSCTVGFETAGWIHSEKWSLDIQRNSKFPYHVTRTYRVYDYIAFDCLAPSGKIVYILLISFVCIFVIVYFISIMLT